MPIRDLCSVLFLAAVAFGQTTGKQLSLADCIRLANSVPSGVTVARQEAVVANLGIAVGRASFLPHAGLSGGAIYNTPRSDRQAFVSFNGPREYITQAGIAAEIDTSGRLRAAYARAKVDRDMAQTNVQLSERDLRRAVTVAFYRVVVARKLAEAAQQSLDEARKFEARVKTLLSGGEAAQADVIKASAQVVTFDQAKRGADLDAQLANQELASYWTSDVDTKLDLEDTLLTPGEDLGSGEPAGAFLRRPEFRLFDLQKRGFLLDAKRERAMLLPQVSLGLQYGIDANRYAWRERGAALVASLNVPIFDWFRARSMADQFKLRSEQVTSARGFTERVYSREYESAKARLASIAEQAKLAQTQVNLFQENLKLSQVRYEGGEGPALDVVLSQLQLQQARSNYFNTLFAYAGARADMEVAAGR